MFKVRIELVPEGGWDAVPEQAQFDLFREDEMPYIPQIGSSYYFELPNKDLTGATVAQVSYYPHDKSTTVVLEVLPHLWEPDKFLQAGWQNE